VRSDSAYPTCGGGGGAWVVWDVFVSSQSTEGACRRAPVVAVAPPLPLAVTPAVFPHVIISIIVIITDCHQLRSPPTHHRPSRTCLYAIQQVQCTCVTLKILPVRLQLRKQWNSNLKSTIPCLKSQLSFFDITPANIGHFSQFFTVEFRN